MKKLEIGNSGAFKESAQRFTDLRKQKPTEADVVEIIEKAKKGYEKPRAGKSARPRDLET